MAQSIQGSLPHCPDPTDADRRNFVQIPRALHALAETPREYELLVALVEYRWYPTSPIIPSVSTLAETLRCSQRTVRRTAAALEARGLILREERRAADRRQMSNEYVLCGPLLAAVTAVEAARDREEHQPWQGRRTAVAGKREEWKNTKRTTRIQPGQTRPKAEADASGARRSASRCWVCPEWHPLDACPAYARRR